MEETADGAGEEEEVEAEEGEDGDSATGARRGGCRKIAVIVCIDKYLIIFVVLVYSIK